MCSWTHTYLPSWFVNSMYNIISKVLQTPNTATNSLTLTLSLSSHPAHCTFVNVYEQKSYFVHSYRHRQHKFYVTRWIWQPLPYYYRINTFYSNMEYVCWDCLSNAINDENVLFWYYKAHRTHTGVHTHINLITSTGVRSISSCPFFLT